MENSKDIVFIAVAHKLLSVFVEGKIYEAHTLWSYEKPSIAREVWHKYAKSVNEQDFNLFAIEMKNMFPGKTIIYCEDGEMSIL